MVAHILAIKGAVAAVSTGILCLLAKRDYARMARHTPIPIDVYVGEPHPAFMDQLQCVMIHWYTRMTRTIHNEPFRLVAEDNPHIPHLQRTRAAKENETATETSKSKAPLVIGTIRMGFGHHRISYAVASYATTDPKVTKDRDVYFHDIATIGNDESSLVDEGETLYSYASGGLTELPNKLERMLSSVSAGGGTNALRMQVHEAALMVSLMAGLDKDSPIIATHPLVGAIAIACNFTNVINLVVDNHPQWFVIVPGALNLVQGPKLYRELMKLGMPDDQLQLVGHWNPRNIVESIPEATQRRIQRIESKQPLRLLIPVGGAGAQRSFLVDLVKECAPLVREGKLELFLNAGDHDHMEEAFQKQLEDSGLEYELVSDIAARSRVEAQLQKGKKPTKPVTVFHFPDPYGAVTTTDRLVPYSDVLVCKPSEMAFYAVPKLMIRRVGDHEAKSATRAAEVGEGTLEAGTIPEVLAELHQFWNKPGDLITMNRMIQKNHEVGMYDGAKKAVQIALERAAQREIND